MAMRPRFDGGRLLFATATNSEAPDEVPGGTRRGAAVGSPVPIIIITLYYHPVRIIR